MNKMVNEIYYSGGTFLSTNKSTQPKKGRIDIELPFKIRVAFNSLLRTENSPLHASKENSLKNRNMYFFKFIYAILHKIWFLRPSNEDQQYKYTKYFLIHTHVCNKVYFF